MALNDDSIRALCLRAPRYAGSGDDYRQDFAGLSKFSVMALSERSLIRQRAPLVNRTIARTNIITEVHGGT